MTDVRVLIVDDQRVVREGLQMLLGLLDGVAVLGAACDGREALDAVVTDPPDVVLMDLNMPRMDGIEATRTLARDHPDVPVVVLTTYTDDERVFAALQAGAVGFLTKDAGAAEIEAALRAAARGQMHLDPDVQRRLVEQLRSGAAFAVPSEPGPLPSSPPDGLTAREAEVVQLVALGRSNNEIAQALYVSPATVKTHINHIFAKTGLRDRAQLVRYAYQTGLAHLAGESQSRRPDMDSRRGRA
jgi:DNA-binding NarL/FixJ family response regulator